MNIGTRVTHNRYPWMVGVVSDHQNNTPTHVVVQWYNGSFYGAAMPEHVNDLRATPVQIDDHGNNRCTTWED